MNHSQINDKDLVWFITTIYLPITKKWHDGNSYTKDSQEDEELKLIISLDFVYLSLTSRKKSNKGSVEALHPSLYPSHLPVSNRLRRNRKYPVDRTTFMEYKRRKVPFVSTILDLKCRTNESFLRMVRKPKVPLCGASLLLTCE